MSASIYYPDSGKPKTKTLVAAGGIPSREEAERLKGIPFDRKGLSKEEAKDSLKWFAFGVIAAIALWLFGGWVIGKFKGLGVLVFGYGFKYLGGPIMVVFGISSLLKLFRSARKKKPFDAMKWIWITSLVGDDGVGDSSRFGKKEYALATMERIIPSGISFSEAELSGYIDQVRSAISHAADENTLKVKAKQTGWSESYPMKELRLKEEKDLFEGVKQLHAVLTYQDCLSKTVNNKTDRMISAIVEINITQTFICSGGYWFPYEIICPVTEEQTPAAQAEKKETEE